MTHSDSSKNGQFEAFRAFVGEVPFTITHARFERQPDGDGFVRDWLVIEGQPNMGGVITGTIRIELPAVIAMASFAISQKAQHAGRAASADLKEFTDELRAAARKISEGVPSAAEAGWKALVDELFGGVKKHTA